jgi:peptide/nickel transport system substrate-binding protein
MDEETKPAPNQPDTDAADTAGVPTASTPETAATAASSETLSAPDTGLTAAPEEPAASPAADAEPIEDSPTPAEPGQEPTGAGPAPVMVGQSPKPKKHLGWLWVVLAIIIIAAGGYVAWSQLHDSSSTTTTTIKDVPLLRVGSLDGPIGPDYMFPNAQATSLSLGIDLQVFEGLAGYQGQKLVPLLATSWTNPNKNTWVFQIAKNVKFQNGDALTPTDIVNSIEADMQNDGWNTYTSTIASIKATGPNEVTITTSQPNSLLLNQLVYCLIFKKSADGTYYGTGPYTVDTTKPYTDTDTTTKAFEAYHGGSPKTKSVHYHVYNSIADMTKAYRNKQIDVYSSYASAGNVGPAITRTEQEPGSFGLFLNMTRPNGVMANEKVREAVAYAFDRQDLVKQLGGKYSPTQQVVPKSVVGYDASATFPGFDIAKSKQLQAEAGYPDGVPVTFLYIKGLQTDPPILIKQLQAAGFKVTDDGVASPDDAVAQTKSGSYDIIGASVFSNYNDATDVFATLLDSQSSEFPVYDNPQFDAMIDAAQQAFDPATHIQKLQTIDKFIASNYLWIPLRTNADTIVSAPSYNVVNNYSLATTTISFWQVGQTVTTTQK